MLSNDAIVLYKEILSTIYSPDFTTIRFDLGDLISDIDAILGTSKYFLFGTWIEDARAFGETKEEQDLYEFNARNLLTLWGPKGNIRDYSVHPTLS